jgi:hypothetical protein
VARRSAALLFVPLALAGAEGAHATANALVGAPANELFTASSPSRAALPPVATLLGLLLLAGLVLRGARQAPARRARLLGLLAPLAFVLLEVSEARLGDDHGWHFFATAPFAVGLALQLPFTAAAYGLARLLTRAGDALDDSLARLVRVPLPSFVLPRSEADPADAVPQTPRGRRRGRAPPLSVVLPG